MLYLFYFFLFFFFNDTATTEIYTLSLHDALPIWVSGVGREVQPIQSTTSNSAALALGGRVAMVTGASGGIGRGLRSGEHTSELQSQSKIVCRLLLVKKKKLKIEPYREESVVHNLA